MPRRKTGPDTISGPSGGRQPGGGRGKVPKPPKNPFAGMPGMPGADGRVVMPEDAFKKPKANARETLRRQRVLKNLGYAIVVDGVWGSRSQRAWQDYLRRRASGDLRNSPFKPEGRTGRVDLPTMEGVKERRPKGVPEAVVTPQELAAQQKAQREQRQREVVRQRKEIKAEIAVRAKAIRAEPTSARQLSLRELTDVLVDREVGVGVETAAGARAVQSWLVSRGHDVRVTGRYDKQTHEALLRAFKRAERREQAKRLHGVRDLLTQVGVKPGDKPEWFPLEGGIPTPKELDRMIQQGGFTASLVQKSLLEHINESFIFNQIRQTELRKLAAQLQPLAFGLGKDKLALDPDLLMLYASIVGATDLMDFADVSKLTPEEQERYRELRAGSQEIQEQNAKRVLGVRAETHALMSASDPEEFKRILTAQMALAEKKYGDVQKRIAGLHAPWWGKAIERVLAPGEFMRTALVYDVMRGLQLGDRLLGGEGRNIRWEDAEVVLGRDPKTIPNYDGAAENANRLLAFGFELVADPLNFAHPFRTASTFLRWGTKGSTIGRYGLAGEGRIWSKALVYERGTWDKAALGERLLRADDLLGVSDTPFVRRARAAWEAELGKLTQLREEAIAKANRAVMVQIRNGFKKPGVVVPGYKGVTAKNERELRAAIDHMKSQLLESPEMDDLLDALKSDAASLYVDAERTTYSNVGAALLANWAEKFRVGAIHQLATEAADQVSRDMLARGSLREERILAVNEEYRRLVEDAGVYIMGVSAAGPTGTAGLLGAEIFGRTTARMDDIEQVLLPAIQDILEEAAGGAKMLFDPDDLLWIGRRGESAQSLRHLGRQSFDDSDLVAVKNPVHDVPHTHAQFMDAVEAEIRRRTPRIYGYAARHSMAGTLPEGFSAESAAEEIRQELLTKAWKKGDDGMYRDTRETLMVSALYARQSEEAYRRLTEGAWEAMRDSKDVLDHLALPPASVVNRPVDDGLWKIAWMMGSRFKTRKELALDHPTRRSFLPESAADDAERFEQGKNFLEREFERGARFQNSVASAKVQLADAADQALPRELGRQRAYLVALSKAQSRKAKIAYLALYGSMAVWRFATLPLRFGWVVRNTIDNVAKILVKAVRDPRYFFLGAAQPGAGVKSIFELDLNALRQAATFFDRLFGTTARQHLDELIDQMWELSSPVLSRIFKAHALPPTPEGLLDAAKMTLETRWRSVTGNVVKVSVDDYVRAGLPVPKDLRRSELQLHADRAARNLDAVKEELAGDTSPAAMQRLATAEQLARTTQELAAPTTIERVGAKIAKTPDLMWDLMASRPENFFKRILYRSEYDRVLRELEPRVASGSMERVEAEVLAHEAAWDSVVDTLFDYSKISVLEDNFKVFLPFVQFWRKNTTFWIESFASKPWLDNAVLQFDQERREAHTDLPGWMQRYLHTDEFVDAAGVVPGLDTVVELLLPDDVMFDPMSFASFSPLYRAYRDAFYGDNQNLPSDKPGMFFLGPMLDAMNEWGLSMNPLVRKPLESLGIASQRSWQRIFPQTPILSALQKEFLESGAFGHTDWASSFERLLGGASSDDVAENFEFYVQQEIAGQVARGEEPSRVKAEATIKGWFYIQNVWGYFGGIYWRRATPEDIYLSKIQSGLIDFDSLSESEKSAMKLWSMRGMDRLTFDRYVDMLPLVEAYYRLESPADKAKLVEKHPELRRHVSAAFRGKPFSGKWLRDTRRYTDTARFFNALKLVDAVDAPFDVRQDALDMFATPELRRHWESNDTPGQLRDRQLRGEVFRYYRDLNESYFSIPETDFEARDGFLDEHPELVRQWNQNNDPSDDFDALAMAATAALREQYFDIVNTKGWDAAAPLLKRHPFMFDGTKAEDKIDQETGAWKTGGGGSGGKWSAERQSAFLAAKPHLNWFFDVYMKQVGEKAAWAWLEVTETQRGAIVRDYLKKYSKQSAASIAYMKAKPWLAIYWGMPEDERQKWLNSDAEGAKIVRDFFEKYAGDNGLSKHAKDYLDTKKELDFYFAIPKEQRSAWLNGTDPRARKVLEYFKRYGKAHQFERLLKKYPALATGTPEQRKRILFWQEYFSLTPDKRPAFILANAEAAGVFIYGQFGEAERHDQEMEWLRRSVGLPLNDRQRAFLYVRPLLLFYRTLDGPNKALFLRANPELQEYFNKYVTKSMTGDKKLDSLVEEYFSLPPDSIVRSEFLRKHPEVQDWFDKRSSPAERAMRNLLEQYFALRSAGLREEFLADHPEVAAYFEQRRVERSNESAAYDAFDRSDPRLREFFESAEDLERSAAMMRDQLKRSAYDSMGGIETRRERRRETTASV